MKNYFFHLILILFLSSSCVKNSPIEEAKLDSLANAKNPVVEVFPKIIYDLSLLNKCVEFNDVPLISVMAKQEYDEISGIAESLQFKDIIYIHEDKPGKNFIYITNKKGEDLGRIVIDGVAPADWEDMTVGPGPLANNHYIYVADIGDNNALNPYATIYRFVEPTMSGLSSSKEIHIKEFDKIRVSYSKGSTNAETILLDPLTRDLYILTKENSKTHLYQIPYPQSTTAIIPSKPMALLGFDYLTSGGISTDGQEILLRNKSQIWYWKRTVNETILNTLSRKPLDAPYAANEHQGEAITFKADRTGFMTISETKGYPNDVSRISLYVRK